ncbi:MAG: efflux RND transporter periplasmic adaptor subunit [Candidatus Latescibacterota bacterium]|jgi:multidrug efflux system membrane fusion protein
MRQTTRPGHGIRSVHPVRPSAGLLILALALLTAVGALAQERPKAAARPVVTAPVQIQATPLSVPAVGTVEPIQSVSVRAQVGGVVTRVAFEEGGSVTAGQLLFQIDPRPLQAALAAAQAQLARDQAQAAHAQTQAARLERLVAKDYVTREQYDAARTQAAVFKPAVQADEAAVEKARLELAYASVTSPIAGRAGAALIKKGNVVRANDAAMVVVNQLQPIWVTFAVPGTQLPLVRQYATAAGDELEVRCVPTRDGSAPPLSGRLVFIDNAVDPKTGTVTLKAEFDNGDGALWPGQFVDTELVLTVEREALTVPAVAVVTGQDGSFVWVVGADGKVQRRPVQVRRTVNGTAVLAEGPAAGERLVTDGQMWLVPGATVVVKADRAGRGSAP